MSDFLRNHGIVRRLKNGVKRLLPKTSQGLSVPEPVYHSQSYAQVGEDLVLRGLLGDKQDGFYVDVGAHHPQRFSVTYFFYQRNWRGINIDAMPGSMAVFQALRPRDINLEIAVSDRRQTLTYYSFDEPALNGFSEQLSLARNEQNRFHIVSQQAIQTYPLSEILDTHLPPGQSIDILNVDVEGLDFDVLRSNDWSKYRPTIVLAEETEAETLNDLDSVPLISFLRDQGYLLHSKAVHTLFFMRADVCQERSS